MGDWRYRLSTIERCQEEVSSRTYMHVYVYSYPRNATSRSRQFVIRACLENFNDIRGTGRTSAVTRISCSSTGEKTNCDHFSDNFSHLRRVFLEWWDYGGRVRANRELCRMSELLDENEVTRVIDAFSVTTWCEAFVPNFIRTVHFVDEI